jgi:hypothetical protein
VKAVNWIVALIGVWFIIAPWAMSFSSDSTAVWTSVIVGAIQVIVALWAAAIEDAVGWGVWQLWIALLAGVWFIIQPFVMSHGSGELWTSLILGIITVILSLASLGKKSSIK